MDDQEPGLPLVHLLRGITVELDLLGAGFARLHKLHPTDVRALIALLDAGRAGITPTPGWLAQQLGLDSSSVTALVDRLERLGHLRRRPDPGDRRRVLLEVQEQAMTLGWSFFGPLIIEMATAMRSFDESELATIRRFLQEMTRVVVASRRGQDEEEATR